METEPQPAGSPASDFTDGTGPSASPLLSIGLAVYNGATHLRESIDSLLAQDIGDLELIISDNASTDETGAICLEYAAADKRVRYSRNETNIGAAANFNRVFELSRGAYFMWGSDDDLWDPQFARLCIDRLELAPAAVMCTSQVTLIDADGDVITDTPYESVDTEGMSVDRRVFEMTKQAAWFDTYSVIRPGALRATQLMLPTFGMDVRLQLELLLQGESLVVPLKLRCYRLPNVGKTASEYVAEIGPESAGVEPVDEREAELRTPFTYLARELLKVVRASRLDSEMVQRIEADLVETLTLVNTRWGGFVLEESGFERPEGITPPARRAAIRSALGLEAVPEVANPAQTAWQPLEGMRMQTVRRLLLRLLQPFAERQDELNSRRATEIELLDHEVEWLGRRVRHLEHSRRAERDSG